MIYLDFVHIVRKCARMAKQGSAVRLSEQDEAWIEGVIKASENRMSRTDLVRLGVYLLRDYVAKNGQLPPIQLKGFDLSRFPLGD